MKGLDHFEPSCYYHIVNHAVGSENLFRNDENFSYFLRKYAQYMPAVCSTLAYCLMPNHIHFLVKTHSEDVLQIHPKYKGDMHKLIMQELSNLLNAYAKAYNKVYKRRGALWIDFTKRFTINSNSYLAGVINYIHQNPVNHGFVNRPADWKFSSYNSLFSEQLTLLSRAEVIEYFGGINNLQEYHKNQAADLMADWEY